jgi:septum formation protein
VTGSTRAADAGGQADPAAAGLILASASPRRAALLRQIGYGRALIVPAAIDPRPQRRELPRDLAKRRALAKAQAVAARHPGHVILAADTVAARGRRILPVPAGEAAAAQCLTLLSSARHRVYGTIVVITPDGRTLMRSALTVVAFKRLSGEEIAGYLASGEWRDQAGGYALDGQAAAFVRMLNGSPSNVLGLPQFETAALLRGAGLRPAPEPVRA